MGTALLVIDMLNDFFATGPLSARRTELSRNINTLISSARERDCPVVWVRQEFSPDLSDAFLAVRRKHIAITVAGTEGCRILPELDRRSHDHEIVKRRYSAFFRTDLDALLATLRAARLVIAGINTHACVRMAAIDAYQRDYEVVIVPECVDSPDLEHHEVTLSYLGKEIAELRGLDQVFDGRSE